MSKKIAIIGLGWLGLPLAKSLHAKGYDIIGSTTRSEKLMRLLDSKLSVRIIKVEKNGLLGDWNRFIEDVDLLIINLPPGGAENNQSDYPQKINQVVSRCDATLKVIFVSSTSVYGDNNEIVTEESSTEPTKVSGEAVLAAEKLVLAHFGKNATIVRFAGLIGENRHPGRFLDAGTLLTNPAGKVNLIERSDCIRLIEAIYEQQKFGEIYNGCSDAHPTREEFYTKAAYNVSLAAPTFKASPADSWKIVSNEKSKRELAMNYSSLDDYFDRT